MESEHLVTPNSVAGVIQPIGVWWAVAGGWDRSVARATAHHDVEIVVQRDDQGLVHERLADDWEMQYIDPPGGGWRDWDGREFARPAFQAKAWNNDSEFDLFFEDVDPGAWTYRRDFRVRRSLSELTRTTVGGLPAVRPEIQLLYMSGHAEPKNRADLTAALPELDAEARTWLRDSLKLTTPGHSWLLDIDA